MNIFIFRAIISFIVGGLFISLQTLLAERVPLRWRGIVLTIPSTLAMGLFFIGLTKGPTEVAPVAVISVAATFTCVYIFALAFAFFSRWGAFIAMAAAFVFWALSAAFLLIFPPQSFGIALLIGIPVFIIVYYLANKLPHFTHITPVPFTAKHIILRALFAGLVVVTTVVSARTLGNVWGGLFSTFPAVFSTTLLIYYFAHGKDIIPAVVKSFFFPGAICFALYAITASISFPRFGIWIGTLISYLVVAVFIFLFQKIKGNDKIIRLAEIELTDGVITLKPFAMKDAEAHLAGEDDEQQKWVSGGKSILKNVQDFIERSQKYWEAGGPVYTFAIWSENKLLGMVEANTDTGKIEKLSEGDANISYSLYPEERGKGYATRAVNLMTEFLKEKGLKRGTIRVSPENKNSLGVPMRCSFILEGSTNTKEGEMLLYTKEL